MDNLNKRIGEVLKAHRVISGKSMQYIGDKLGVSRQCVNGWESGYRAMNAIDLINYCLALELDPDSVIKEIIAGMKK